jgi:membrane protease YdiL (CAAX protease family)
MVRLARTYPLASFYLLAFTLSWIYWIGVIATGGRAGHFPGLAGPALAAVVATGLIGGKAGLFDLVHRMLRWRVPLRWYLAALVPAGTGALAVLGSIIGGSRVSAVDLTTMDGVPTRAWLPFLLVVLIVNGYGEEVGWRGFAWDRHRSRHDIFGAALRLASLWALWHLPTFWLATGMTMEPWMIPAWLISLLAGAVVLGWLYERSGRSLVVVALFHTCLNLASATTATAPVAAVTSAVVIVWAVMIIKGGRPP